MEWIKDNYTVLIANPLVRSALIILGSIVVAKITDLVFTGIFKRLTEKTRTGLDDKIVNLLHRPIFYSILFIGFSMAVKTAALPAYIDFALVGLFKTATILIWLFLISKVFMISMEWASGRTANRLLQQKTLPLFNNLGKIAIGLFGAYFIFLSWDININGILASAGVLGVVLGLAAKDTVANFFAGIFLMADSPFKEGDYILLETGERGYVKSMGLRSTRIMTRDDIEITIPNSVIASSKIVNESGGPEDIERVRITLLVAYGSDIDEVKILLKSIALANDNVQNSPEPRVRFREFAESGIKLQLLFWIYKPEIRGRTVDAVNTQIYKQFATNNITIPYPTMKVLLPENSK
ncbi:MAG: mechanosensitive ion channel family protein [Candidatus Marinimicrobia bacterium]|jgi:small-conductance mechanosensitive channel|nr:mechanosensitive ion channel family protein [Candidatus Neomarinimicrobiota bacterium]MDP6611624.1 mechanosensitive ion channel family protein [Candidatus Neomarinimicrobiota bacterium]|tara:strand:+ start:85 stop:1140 length:1056 start_codon:yes stop_codon:yes gene_type:complete